MDASDIQITDWARILNGGAPAGFYVELIIRSAVIYALMVVSMRLLGQRMAGQLNRTEQAAVVTLAAAAGVPLISPDRGVLAAVVIAAVVIGITRASSRLAARGGRTQSLVDGNLSPLVVDSVLQLDQMKHARVSRERLFAQLRTQSFRHLGEVERFYMEASGTFSVITNSEPKPGLCILPSWDKPFLERQQVHEDQRICARCGAHRNGEEASSGPCPRCGSSDLTAAVS